MKIIIAPTKKMVVNTDDFDVLSQPQYLDDAQAILQVLKQLTYEQAKAMWHCSDKLARENFAWLQEMSLTQHQTPAILGYTGIQYQYMAPDLFTAPALDYIQANLRILTGFYGILRPFDGVVPYRLEMQSAVAVNQTANLYQFWGDRLHAALQANDGLILNLASQEYAKAITPYLTADEHMVDVVFASLVNGKPKVKATFAKMARGEMVRYLAENQISDLADVAKFDHPDWHFDADRSTANQLVFIDNGHRH
ncbi:hypothetical protein FD04_GL000257 [Secundilactobacillus odoratitofui DSM 19909 = JCM 15043]|uniref:UPF0246 protein FD04_GL000257 n=1 Tax=Secundilactobacillus odoratitofui DSM 19909 = JCM 15043 TaxID=1423776 RepID=A0A0R1LS44_9LACO|nr:peroxide stress protein YaaA [Secundilactobacillus odoratitofui]KRK98525.1 hypothetical protein FD04_GL000257 [Secundilactobacillus odoratitofui DSM 19909 = JCM 15043]